MRGVCNENSGGKNDCIKIKCAIFATISDFLCYIYIDGIITEKG